MSDLPTRLELHRASTQPAVRRRIADLIMRDENSPLAAEGMDELLGLLARVGEPPSSVNDHDGIHTPNSGHP